MTEAERLSEMQWLPTGDTTLTDAALAYAEHGFRVLAVWGVAQTPKGARCGCGKADCPSRGKHPIGKAWQKTATTDVCAVRDARHAHPTANVGLAMGGPERLITVDRDGEPGRASWHELEAKHGPVPTTLTTRTGREDGGDHFVFRVPAHLDVRRIKNRSGVLPGIDTRGENGQIVAPPSLHESGARYEFTVRAPIADIPDWLFEALAGTVEVEIPRPEPEGKVFRIANAYVAKVITNAARDIAAAPSGQRNNKLFAKSATCFEYCIGEGIDHKEAWRALFQAGKACGLGRKEVEVTLNKAWRAALDSPRYAPAPTVLRAPPSPRGRQADERPAPRTREPGEDDDVEPAPRMREPGEDDDLEPLDAESEPPAGGASNDAPAPPTPAQGAAEASSLEEGDNWEGELVRSAEAGIKNTFGNVCKILRRAPEYRGRFSFHEMKVSSLLDAEPVRDADVGHIREHIEATWFFPPSQEAIVQAIQTVAAEKSFHPVRRYLSSLKWDGELRIHRIAERVFGITHPDPVQQRMLRAWFVSAVARAMQPGCKVDTALVLVGPQGYRKSTFFATLGGEWFADSHMDITTKDGVLQLHSAWIYEWAEIENVTSRKQAAEVKAFITCATDSVRPPFGRAVMNQPRSVVIVGSTNEDQFLDDPTGSRRFWILRIQQPIVIDLLREWRDQLWAEAVAAHAAGEPWWLDSADEAAREKSADQHRIDDPWEEPIRAWLDKYLNEPRLGPPEITSHLVLKCALHLDAVHQHANAMARAGKCLRRLGYANERRRLADGTLVRVWQKVA